MWIILNERGLSIPTIKTRSNPKSNGSVPRNTRRESENIIDRGGCNSREISRWTNRTSNTNMLENERLRWWGMWKVMVLFVGRVVEVEWIVDSW